MPNVCSCKCLRVSTVLFLSVSTLLIRLIHVCCRHLDPKLKKDFHGRKVKTTDTRYFNLIGIQLESNCKLYPLKGYAQIPLKVGLRAKAGGGHF